MIIKDDLETRIAWLELGMYLWEVKFENDEIDEVEFQSGMKNYDARMVSLKNQLHREY